MKLSLPTPLPRPVRLPDLHEVSRIASAFAANSTGFDMSLLGMTLLKSFGILVGRGDGATPKKRSGDLAIGTSGDRLFGRTLQPEQSKATVTSPGRRPEDRYAYYRRCQQFRRNGQQCKAPAVKGEPLCHKHAEQAAMDKRRVRQRGELLARPGLGFGDFKAVQRTISAVAQALLDGRIDAKTAGGLIIELQTASKLLWQQHLLNRRGHRGTQKKKELRKQEPRKEEKQLTGKVNPHGCRERRWPAVAAQMANPRECRETRCSAVAGHTRPGDLTSLALPRPALLALQSASARAPAPDLPGKSFYAARAA
jgi:hypothetical protein